MMLSDFHVHTTYCDGKSTPGELVASAVRMGLGCIGFSGHSYTDFDLSCCMSRRDTECYIRDITALKEKYAGKIKIFCGIEQDYFSLESTEDYDYVIGSVHYVKCGDGLYTIDDSKETFVKVAEDFFSGDYYSLAESYYEIVGDIAEKLRPDIIGHFDLITKFNEGNTLFDTAHPRYVSARNSAADKLLSYGIPFEINTGAMSRGYRSTPYPENDIIDYISAKGGSFILSGDTHHADALCYGFDRLELPDGIRFFDFEKHLMSK